jgi:phenylalanyl-tRNA synthetase beta subunit
VASAARCPRLCARDQPLTSTFASCRVIGVIGVIHPAVASNFSVPFACSGLEMDIEHFSVKK